MLAHDLAAQVFDAHLEATAASGTFLHEVRRLRHLGTSITLPTVNNLLIVEYRLFNGNHILAQVQ